MSEDASELPLPPRFVTVFVPEPGESVVSMTKFRGEIYIATNLRVLRWDAENKVMSPLELLMADIEAFK